MRKHCGDGPKDLAKALAFWKERANLAPCEVLAYTPYTNRGAMAALRRLIAEDGLRRSRSDKRASRPKRKVLYRWFDLEELGAGTPPQYCTLDEYKAFIKTGRKKPQCPTAKEIYEMRKALRPGGSSKNYDPVAGSSPYGIACEPIRNYKTMEVFPPIRRHSSKLRGANRERFERRLNAYGETFNLVYYGIR